jgi:hypothetical protein
MFYINFNNWKAEIQPVKTGKFIILFSYSCNDLGKRGELEGKNRRTMGIELPPLAS